MTSPHRIAATTTLILLLAIAGCDSAGSDDGGGGEPSSVVTGTIEVPGQDSQEFQGTVYFAGGVESEMQGFGIYAEPNEGTDFSGSRAILFRFADRPGTDTYTVVPPSEADDDDFTGEVRIESEDFSGTFSAQSGTLTIETSTSERVEGSFMLTAEPFPGQTATVEGDFDAGRRSDFEVPDNRQ
jgi:hypothetical protein